MNNEREDSQCCPPFDPEPWDGKLFEWNNKKFIKDKVFTLFFMPINFGSVIRRLGKKVDEAGGQMTDWLCLSDHASKFRMDLLLAVDKEISGAENITLSGKFLSKVYEGDFKETGEWCKDFEEYAENRGLKVDKWYMWYTTCPKCAKKYGKNYVAIIAQVE